MNGQPNLTLFSQLYWVVVEFSLVFVCSVWPLSPVIKGKYILQDSNRGRACLLGNMPDDSFEEHLKFRLIGIALLLLIVHRIIYIKRKVKNLITGMCPKGKMACFGGLFGGVLWLRSDVFQSTMAGPSSL